MRLQKKTTGQTSEDYLDEHADSHRTAGQRKLGRSLPGTQTETNDEPTLAAAAAAAAEAAAEMQTTTMESDLQTGRKTFGSCSNEPE